MLLPRHRNALENIKNTFRDCGYNLSFQLLNARNFNVPQDRSRVFFIGIRNDLNLKFKFPNGDNNPIITLKEAIGDLENNGLPALDKNKSNGDACIVPNHEFMIGGFSSLYMSRNRVRSWNETSYTIQASGRHAPLHPQAPKMIAVEPDVRKFVEGKENLYRRLSVRECARIQTFPDNFIFHYKNIDSGYKMVGNAVAIEMGYSIATSIYSQLTV